METVCCTAIIESVRGSLLCLRGSANGREYKPPHFIKISTLTLKTENTRTSTPAPISATNPAAKTSAALPTVVVSSATSAKCTASTAVRKPLASVLTKIASEAPAWAFHDERTCMSICAVSIGMLAMMRKMSLSRNN